MRKNMKNKIRGGYKAMKKRKVKKIRISEIISWSRGGYEQLLKKRGFDPKTIWYHAVTFWVEACKNFSIPISHYWNRKDLSAQWPIPEEIKSQVRHFDVANSITYQEKEYMVVELQGRGLGGIIIDIESVALAPLEYFLIDTDDYYFEKLYSEMVEIEEIKIMVERTKKCRCWLENDRCSGCRDTQDLTGYMARRAKIDEELIKNLWLKA